MGASVEYRTLFICGVWAEISLAICRNTGCGQRWSMDQARHIQQHNDLFAHLGVSCKKMDRCRGVVIVARWWLNRRCGNSDYIADFADNQAHGHAVYLQHHDIVAQLVALKSMAKAQAEVHHRLNIAAQV